MLHFLEWRVCPEVHTTFRACLGSRLVPRWAAYSVCSTGQVRLQVGMHICPHIPPCVCARARVCASVDKPAAINIPVCTSLFMGGGGGGGGGEGLGVALRGFV